MFFKKKKEEGVNNDAVILKREAKELLNDHKKVKSDIEYLNTQYEIFVLKSLMVEFPLYKEAIEKDFSEGQEKDFWMIDRVRSSSFYLQKIPDIKNKYRTRIVIDIDHNGQINGEFDLKSIKVESTDRRTTLSTSKFKDIIFKYIMAREIAMSKKHLEITKNSFAVLSNLIGKDVHRDAKIDQILK
jgi:hypothetical protein